MQSDSGLIDVRLSGGPLPWFYLDKPSAGENEHETTVLKEIDMKRDDLARALAVRGRLTEGEAQDELDRVVHRIVKNLRQGRPAEMPGVGRLIARRRTARLSPKSAVRTPAA